MIFGYFDCRRLEKELTKANNYQKAAPFPHTVIDNAGCAYMMRKVEECFLYYRSGTQWHKYDNVFEKKFASDDIATMPSYIQQLVCEMNSDPFVRFLEKLTGIDALITDSSLRGAGMHEIKQGGKLDIHADFNWHPRLKLKRAVNVLLYLNSDWNPDWRGALELWDKGMKKCVKSIEPLFNRMVVFTSTEDSYHGHPHPLLCPENKSRRSIAMYYYTSTGKEEEEAHSTLFKALPGEKTSETIEEFRKRRGTFQTYGSKK